MLTSIECPFYPGKNCLGNCPNHEANVQEIMGRALSNDVTVESVIIAIRVNPHRFQIAKLEAMLNQMALTYCDHNLEM